jgi:hypothetical protein
VDTKEENPRYNLNRWMKATVRQCGRERRGYQKVVSNQVIKKLYGYQTDNQIRFALIVVSNQVIKKLYQERNRCASFLLPIQTFKKGTDAYFSSMILVTI